MRAKIDFNENEFLNRLHIANNFIKDRFPSSQYPAAAIIGSTARRCFYPSSDIDILVIHRKGEVKDFSEIYQKKIVNVTFYEETQIMEDFEGGIIDLAKLRLAANLSVAIPLFDNDGILEKLALVNKKLSLDKAIKNYYLSFAKSNISKAQSHNVVLRRKIFINKAVQAMILLILSESKVRVIKPKWTWGCLETIDFRATILSESALMLRSVASLIKWNLLSNAILEIKKANTADDHMLKVVQTMLNDGKYQEKKQPDSPLSSLYLKDCVLTQVIDLSFSAGKARNRPTEDINNIVESSIGQSKSYIMYAVSLYRHLLKILKLQGSDEI